MTGLRRECGDKFPWRYEDVRVRRGRGVVASRRVMNCLSLFLQVINARRVDIVGICVLR